ncbi:hypothetical protein H2199_000635 [Coniosporium tulheliwenetii]|uniref:Uncharacterized protein n=1 Tax=Coniosporium tulheliwenetii TaxID=3383036 RepID=A0ACC2ZMI3_9PEZI|nr:hypothetical protein H2199_000635 [Cladosporium sp. JES 115]
MPTYLLHGFRWPRPMIRIHIILQNLDDCAAEWLMAPLTHSTLLDNFRTLHPEFCSALPNLRFIEQYDPDDTTTKSQPYAYVADVCEEVKLGVDVDEVQGKGVKNEQRDAILGLRDKVAPEAKVAWFVVVCGDVERWVPPVEGDAVDGGATVDKDAVDNVEGWDENVTGNDMVEYKARNTARSGSMASSEVNRQEEKFVGYSERVYEAFPEIEELKRP